MYKFLLLLALIPTMAMGQGVNFRTCFLQPSPHEVRVEGCAQLPCQVQRGEAAVMEFEFTPNAQADDLTPSVTAVVLGLPVNYPLPDDLLDSCSNLVGSSCPVPAGQRTTLGFRFPVNPAYPPISLAVQIQLRNHANTVVSCFTVDIQVLA